ncbi:hypothetical protein BDW71DRAFT_180778 [Aspergillus fruticulosus]
MLIVGHLSSFKDYTKSTHGHYTLVPSTPETRLFKITEDQRSQQSTLGHLSHQLDPSFCLPSRHALARLHHLLFGDFHTHMSFHP